jgi:catechol 2,3-dioxygenase-like lactoylglutathione lyase family enzyme
LNVRDLERAIEFYRVLFGVEAAKRRVDYAKFELDDPPLVLSLEPNPHAAGGALNHLGFRLPETAALVAMQARLEAAGIATNREEGVECCYAKQTKFWVTDADRNLWEIYILEDDLDHKGPGQTLEAMLPKVENAKPPDIWEHRMGDEIPARIPWADESLDQVSLRGTLNAASDAPTRARLMSEALRVLRPGGRIDLHMLVADRPFPDSFPQLPGPAAAIRRIPIENEPFHLLEANGFEGLYLTKFGESACFQHDGVAMREMKLAAWKPAAPLLEQMWTALYKGPFAEVVDDRGTVYRRGEPVEIDARTLDLLRQSPFAEHLLIRRPICADRPTPAVVQVASKVVHRSN